MDAKDDKYTSLLKEQIATLKKENRYLEFKSNYQEAQKLGKYISALSNGACLDRQDLTLTDAVLLDQVQKGNAIPQEAMSMLKKKKLIEGRKPHIYVAKSVAQTTGTKVEYSKHKGLEDKQCEALLLNSLKDHGCLTKQEVEKLLWNILSDQLLDNQKKNKIDYILRKLKRTGKISNKSHGNNSIWSLVKI